MSSSAAAVSSSRQGNDTGDRRLDVVPVGILLIALAGCVLLLSFAISVPLGPNYWDLPIYLDGSQRIATGQVPAIDFRAPVGALGYYLTYFAEIMFPQGQTLLLVQYSILVITAPLMAIVLIQLGRERRLEAMALLLPFLLFSILPFNILPLSSFPGVDGYGLYNRQVCILIYVLVTAMLFVERRVIKTGFLFLLMTALFFTKITGFAAAGLIAVQAFLSGRVRFVDAVIAASGFLAFLGLVELYNGMVSAYLGGILQLVEMNTGVLLPRFLTVASTKFDVIASAGALILLLIHVYRVFFFGKLKAIFKGNISQTVAQFFDQPVVWLGVVLFAGIVFETQNTGSQEFIFLWPILLLILYALPRKQGWKRWTLAALVAAVAIPTATTIVHRSARAFLSSPTYVNLDLPILGALGRLSTKPVLLERMVKLGDHYAANQPTYRGLATLGQLPAWSFYSEIAMQGGWLIELERAAQKLLEYEKANSVRFNSLYVLDFTSPLAWALKREAPKHVQIGLDPFRTMPPLDEPTKQALEKTDAILVPLCPITTARVKIRKTYQPALGNRKTIALDRCWELLIKNPI